MITLRFKTPDVFSNFCVGLHPMLATILQYSDSTYGTIPVVTSAWREGDTGVHGTIPLRGIDLRSHGINAVAFCKHVNSRFRYDPSRPKMVCALLHDAGSGEHIHLQVHPRTVDTW